MQLYYGLLLGLRTNLQQKNTRFFKELLQIFFLSTVFLGFNSNCIEQDLSAQVST